MVSSFTTWMCCCIAVSSPIICSLNWVSWSVCALLAMAPPPLSLRISFRCFSLSPRRSSCQRAWSAARCCAAWASMAFICRTLSNAPTRRALISFFSSRSLRRASLQLRSFSYRFCRLELENVAISSFAFLACSRSSFISFILSICSRDMPLPTLHSWAVCTIDRVCSRSCTRSCSRVFSAFRPRSFSRTKSSGRGPPGRPSLECASSRSVGSGGSSSISSPSSSSSATSSACGYRVPPLGAAGIPAAGRGASGEIGRARWAGPARTSRGGASL
mmetsp:Transcript_76205/g.212945  ORF Transcript_76205/g.212945 Transcript_76205/m.212945 type:complete len:274 (-) Transcript_76205:24-845(-)